MRGTIKASARVVIASLLAATAGAAPGPDEKPAAKKPAQSVLIGEKDLDTCKKYPPGKRTVRPKFKPETELGDLIAWISSITCKQFLLPGTIPANSRKLTVVAPELITPEEAYRLFLGALDSAGLTIEHAGKFERIVETAKITTMGGIPVLPEGADVPQTGSYVTRMVRRESLSARERNQTIDIHHGPFGPPEEFVFVNEVARVVGPKDVRACKPPPRGTAGIKLNRKPDAKVTELITWIAGVTCKQFLLLDTIPPDGKRVTVVAPQLITPEEAYQLFLAALDSVGLTVDGSGNIPRIFEHSIPEPMITRLIHVEFVDPHEVVQILERIKSERGKVTLIDATGGIIITDLPENVKRMMRVLSQT
jgi:hypothetical protein